MWVGLVKLQITKRGLKILASSFRSIESAGCVRRAIIICARSFQYFNVNRYPSPLRRKCQKCAWTRICEIIDGLSETSSAPGSSCPVVLLHTAARLHLPT